MRKILSFGLLVLILAACAPATSSDVMMEKPADEAMEAKPTDEMMEASDDDMMPTEEEMSGDNAMMEMPAWFSVPLTDVRTGNAFTIKDYEGKVVLVETLAMWCSNCLKQQGEVKALHELLGERDDFISIGLDIDPNESDDDLKDYTDSHGFGWVYAIAPADVSRELGNLYGAQFLNPPSTPMLIIDRAGNVHPLPFGIKSADDLLKALEPFLSESM